MRYITALLLFCIALPVLSQSSAELIIPIRDSIYSKTLNEQREIWIYVPPSASGSDVTRFPVLYLLDAEVFFTLVNGLVHLKSQYERSCPKMIIVGIPNTDRIRDLTPTHSLVSFNGKKDENMLKNSGGGGKFTGFLKDELISYIDSKYPATGERTLLGHSIAGLLVLNTVVHDPDLFNNYVAIDPSIWWDDQKLLKKAATAFQEEKVAGKTFLLAVSNDQKTKRNQRDADEAATIKNFAQEMSEKARLRFAWKSYDNETHATVAYPALEEALEMLKR